MILYLTRQALKMFTCRDSIEPNPIHSFRKLVDVRPHCCICGGTACRSSVCAQLIRKSPEVLGGVEKTSFMHVSKDFSIPSLILEHSSICADMMKVCPLHPQAMSIEAGSKCLCVADERWSTEPLHIPAEAASRVPLPSLPRLC